MIADSAREFVVEDVGRPNAVPQITACENVIILERIDTCVPKECLDFCWVKLSAAIYPEISSVYSFEKWSMPTTRPHFLSQTS